MNLIFFLMGRDFYVKVRQLAHAKTDGSITLPIWAICNGCKDREYKNRPINELENSDVRLFPQNR